MRRDALKRAKVGPDEYRCNHCEALYSLKGVQVDHIEPVVPIDIHHSWDDYITRLFYGALQVLCRECHATKTALENSLR